MNINGVNGMNGVSRINQTSAINRANHSESNAKNVQADQASINGANAVNTTGQMEPNGIRVELVNRIREQIANGTYYTEEKMQAAMLKMFDAIEA